MLKLYVLVLQDTAEALIKAALMLDEGEVETVAHYYAAAIL